MVMKNNFKIEFINYDFKLNFKIIFIDYNLRLTFKIAMDKCSFKVIYI